MRDYFYLSQLESSGYDIGVADALHLGASFKLPLYIYLEGSAYLTDGEGEKVFRENDFHLRLCSGELKRIEKTYVASAIRSPAQIDHLNEFFSIASGIVDERYRGAVPIKILPNLLALMKSGGGCVQVYDKEWIPISGRIGELICYTDDIRKLAEEGSKHREKVEVLDTDTERQEYPPATATPDDEAELKRLQRTVAALALGLAAKPGAYNKAGKPNVLQIAKLATEHLRDGQSDRTPHGFSETTVRSTITAALKACPELKG